MRNHIKDSNKIDYKVFFLMLLTFFTSGQVASDIYVPSLPALFGVAAILLLCNAFPGAFGPFENIAGAAGAV